MRTRRQYRKQNLIAKFNPDISIRKPVMVHFVGLTKTGQRQTDQYIADAVGTAGFRGLFCARYHSTPGNDRDLRLNHLGDGGAK
jgi:hypothetical protein